MTAPVATALPYGIRDIKLTPYTDASGTVLATGDGVAIDLPNGQTLSFSEAEDFEELRGDDRVVTTRGKGATVEFELEAGGISLEAWKVMTGGEIIDSGTTPNRKRILRKRGSTNRPWFRVEGQAISDSGGDIHCIIYRCRISDTLEGEFADGEFMVTSGKGTGLPMLDQAADYLYDFVQNETATAILVDTEDETP